MSEYNSIRMTILQLKYWWCNDMICGCIRVIMIIFSYYGKWQYYSIIPSNPWFVPLPSIMTMLLLTMAGSTRGHRGCSVISSLAVTPVILLHSSHTLLQNNTTQHCYTMIIHNIATQHSYTTTQQYYTILLHNNITQQ